MKGEPSGRKEPQRVQSGKEGPGQEFIQPSSSEGAGASAGRHCGQGSEQNEKERKCVL